MNDFKIHSILARQRTKLNVLKHKWIKKILLGFAFLFASFSVLILLFFLFLLKDLPSISNTDEILFSQSSTIYDRNGEELYIIHGDENRKSIDISEMPDSLVFATLSIEDASFFDHHGFSFKGYVRAAISELLHFGAHKSGGSTLTQQFVKNTFLSSEKTYTRKLKELILSMQLEWKFPKEKILEMYLNSIPYGSNAYGVERASLTFFGKSAREINLAESSVLASLPKAPTFYSPYGEHVRTKVELSEKELNQLRVATYAELLAQVGETPITIGLLPTELQLSNGAIIILPGRTSLVLNRMLELGYITQDERDVTEKQLITYEFQKYKENIRAPHFVMYIRDLLEKKYGKEFLNAGGLQIYTTLDGKLQDFAEQTVKTQVEKNEALYGANNAALISVIPQTGEIVSMVGSRDYWNDEIDGKVNVILQRRLPGSSFKPFAYAAAFSSGYAPATVAFDVEMDFGNNYKPKNFDGKFRGPVTFRKALGNSLNIPAIQAGIVGGLQKTYDIAKGMGVDFPKDAEWYGGALPLGVAEIRPMDMAQAYATFANMGKKSPLIGILKVVDRHGNILEEFDSKNILEEQALDPETAYLITDVLSDPNARGAGWNGTLQLPGRKNAIKTGTSNKRVDDQVLPLDGWVLGYTPELATVVWTGNNNGKPMTMKGSGFSNAGPIWRAFMIEALKGKPATDFEKPSGITTALVSTLTGKLPSADFPQSLVTKEIFSTKNLPTTYDDSLEFITVERVSGDLPNEYTPDDAKKKVALIQWRSLKPEDPNWQGPVNAWAQKYAQEYVSALGVDEVIAVKPTKTETVHNENNTVAKPEVVITSPKAFGDVNKEGVGIWTDITSKNGVALVEFYVNDVLVDSVQSSPFKGTVTFPQDAKEGDSFIIKVKAYDTLYNANSSAVTVKLAKDTTPPITEIIYPKNNSSFTSGSVVTVQTNTYDTRSDIDRVGFYLDGKEIGMATTEPYAYDVVLPKNAGNATLKVIAFDKASNSAESSVTVTITPVQIARSLSVSVPTSILFGDSQEITFTAPIEDMTKLKSLSLIARFESTQGVKTEQALTTLSNFQSNTSGIFHYLWVRPLSGNYSVYVKAQYADETELFSSKVLVQVTGNIE